MTEYEFGIGKLGKVADDLRIAAESILATTGTHSAAQVTAATVKMVLFIESLKLTSLEQAALLFEVARAEALDLAEALEKNRNRPCKG